MLGAVRFIPRDELPATASDEGQGDKSSKKRKYGAKHKHGDEKRKYKLKDDRSDYRRKSKSKHSEDEEEEKEYSSDDTSEDSGAFLVDISVNSGVFSRTRRRLEFVVFK